MNMQAVIPLGDSSYVALYHYVLKSDSVYVFVLGRQKEVGC